MTLRAVLFDWGGTLTPWVDVPPLDPWLHYSGGDAVLAGRLLAAEDAVWDRARREHVSGTLHELFLTCGVDTESPGHRAGLERYLAYWAPLTGLVPDALPVLRALREQGWRLGVLSNTLWPREWHEAVLARDGLLGLLDGAAYSAEMPWSKPHPEAFRAALAEVGLADPAEAVFVGDRLFDDVHGARQVGMRAVWVPHSRVPDHQRGPVEGTPDAVVPRLLDLLDVLAGWR